MEIIRQQIIYTIHRRCHCKEIYKLKFSLMYKMIDPKNKNKPYCMNNVSPLGWMFIIQNINYILYRIPIFENIASLEFWKSQWGSWNDYSKINNPLNNGKFFFLKVGICWSCIPKFCIPIHWIAISLDLYDKDLIHVKSKK